MNRRLYRGVILLLIVFFLAGIAGGLWSITANEGVFLMELPPEESLSPAPKNKAEVLDYLEKLTSHAAAEKPKIEKTREFWIPDGGISFSVENALLDSAASYMRSKISSALNQNVEPEHLTFGEENSLFFRQPFIIAELGVDALFTDRETDEDGREIMWDSSKIELLFAPESPPLSEKSNLLNNFDFSSDEEIKTFLSESLADFFIVDSYSVIYDNFRIDAHADRLSDKLESLHYVKGSTLKLNLSPVGALEPLGRIICTLSFEEYIKYKLTWPGVELDQKKLVMEKGKIDNLLAFITADGDIRADWSSSDESVVTVDEEGYLRSQKFGEATIRAEIEFQGKTYVDECLVQVRISVTGVRLDKRKINLETGQTYQLNAKVLPKKAGLQSVSWHTENPAVAVIDEEGLVQAVAAGETKVFALTDDGSYRSSCTVIVD